MDEAECFLAVSCFQTAVARLTKHRADHFADGLGILYNEDRFLPAWPDACTQFLPTVFSKRGTIVRAGCPEPDPLL